MGENRRIGLDYCGVLITPDRVSREGGTIFDDPAPPETHLQPGVIEAVRTLQESAGGVWIISKARASLQDPMRAYLEEVEFFSRTGVPPSHLHFCLERDEKRTRAEEVRLTDFVDDRTAVLALLDGVVERRFWFSPNAADEAIPAGVTRVESWATLLPQLL